MSKLTENLSATGNVMSLKHLDPRYVVEAIKRIHELEAAIQAVIDCQKRTYGNATELHLDMILIAEQLAEHLEE